LLGPGNLAGGAGLTRLLLGTGGQLVQPSGEGVDVTDHMRLVEGGA
jgi:hypothetical protein